MASRLILRLAQRIGEPASNMYPFYCSGRRARPTIPTRRHDAGEDADPHGAPPADVRAAGAVEHRRVREREGAVDRAGAQRLPGVAVRAPRGVRAVQRGDDVPAEPARRADAAGVRRRGAGGEHARRDLQRAVRVERADRCAARARVRYEAGAVRPGARTRPPQHRRPVRAVLHQRHAHPHLHVRRVPPQALHRAARQGCLLHPRPEVRPGHESGRCTQQDGHLGDTAPGGGRGRGVCWEWCVRAEAQVEQGQTEAQ